MPTRIAHLSDLHYGGSFDLALWQSVEKAVTTFKPHLLIVSGDMADDPREDHLLKAKQNLDRLATSAEAELHVVAGNHDVFFSGLDVAGGRSGWFDHIFNGSAASARVPRDLINIQARLFDYLLHSHIGGANQRAKSARLCFRISGLLFRVPGRCLCGLSVYVCRLACSCCAGGCIDNRFC
jgi:predicted MPP superfamily phosphohydrolase